MAAQCTQVSIPSNGTAATLFASTPANSNQISVRNTGTVDVVLGVTGALFFPLLVNEFLGLQVGGDDTLLCAVKVAGTAGQVTVLGLG